MKILLKLMVLALLLSNCSKSDDNNQPQEPSTQELLLGKWMVTTASYDNIEPECMAQSFFEFVDTERLNYQFVGAVFTLDGTFIDCSTLVNDNYAYTLASDDTFSFTTEEIGFQTFKIVEISASNLVLTTEFAGEVIIILLEKQN